MKVIVLNNASPFTWGGAEELADHLVRNLLASGAQAELLRIPFAWNPPERLIEQMVMNFSFRLDQADRVIPLKFPAYLIPHRDKVFWLLHQYRQAYDLWDAGQSNIPNTPEGSKIRAAISAADTQTFAAATRIYTNSRVTGKRLLDYNGFDSEVLMPPLNDPEIFVNQGDEGYLLAAGRVNAGKRQTLLVDALAYLPPSIRMIVAGPPDSPADAQELVRRVAAAGLQDRVKLDLRFLSRRELADYVGRARAVAYVPFDEDSVGYVTMEAFQASKPVVTTTDSGGLLQIVHDDHTGTVGAPTPRALAEAIAKLMDDPARAAKLGQAGHKEWNGLGITWPHTIEKLLT
ncbi:putative glycosyltransferase [Acidiphilium multivorum AIU301]|uniref:Glycosyl transferase, group 1 n=2 Tax=Acidiphilium TaxID=522 RepID=A5FV86_ACICJ|nr:MULTISPECIES: glycosyltransferase family 4 protein [Acidiphilium]ABQ29518.1 glycosyl transferase, group 1 [Acidiphilium cryptum JF-5]BAJ79668.1 putative glycosyltransferase [Acidiphilium multivorum AIU301]GAN74532.1 glycosyl transferase [Acidiphilium multivorum AIU301]